MTDSQPPASTVPEHDVKRRIGPRRATAPAGPPATASAPAVLVLGESSSPVEPVIEPTSDPSLADATPQAADATPQAGAVAETGAASAPEPTPEPAAESKPALAEKHAESSASELQQAPSNRRAFRLEIATAHKRRRGRWLWLPRVLALLILFAVVAAIGSVVTVPEAPAPAVSASEQSRRTALESVSALRESATALAATATAPAQQAAVASAATTLKKQESALTTPRPATTSATPSSAASSSSTMSSSTQPPTPSDSSAFLAKLTTSGNDAVAQAQTSPGPMARLLLSVGTGQLLAADQVAAALGLPAPAQTTQQPTSSASTPASATVTSTPTVPVTACATPHQPASGANLESALTAVASAEQEAVYAYQVAATRMATTAQSQQATDLLAQHQQAHQAALDALRTRCISVPGITPGYQLSRDFTQKPAAALGTLETQLENVYATVVAFTPAATPADSTRTWASTQYAQAVTRATSWGAAQSSLPGIDEPS